MHNYIPYGKQFLDEDDIDAVVGVLNSDYLTQGPKVTEFEQAICEFTGAKYCVAVANGTAALHIAVNVLDIAEGMEGITTPNTFVASSNCLIYNNLYPVFADIDSKTYCIDSSHINAKVTTKTKLLIPVHFAGNLCDMSLIKNIADDHGLHIIEDAAHAIGSKYSDGGNVGNCKYSDMTIFSFHPVKTMTTGEGGAITTNDSDLYRKLKLVASHGITKQQSDFQNDNNEPHGEWYYEMQTLGFNYRITDIQCALGISQLKKLNGFIKKRRRIVAKYNKAFRTIDGLIIPYEKEGCFISYHLYILQIKDLDRLSVFNTLRENNIGVHVHYIPIHLQPFYKQKFGYKEGDYPIAEQYYQRAITLPLFPEMTDDDVDYIIEMVIETLNNIDN